MGPTIVGACTTISTHGLVCLMLQFSFSTLLLFCDVVCPYSVIAKFIFLICTFTRALSQPARACGLLPSSQSSRTLLLLWLPLAYRLSAYSLCCVPLSTAYRWLQRRPRGREAEASAAFSRAVLSRPARAPAPAPALVPARAQATHTSQIFYLTKVQLNKTNHVMSCHVMFSVSWVGPRPNALRL